MEMRQGSLIASGDPGEEPLASGVFSRLSRRLLSATASAQSSQAKLFCDILYLLFFSCYISWHIILDGNRQATGRDIETSDSVPFARG